MINQMNEIKKDMVNKMEEIFKSTGSPVLAIKEVSFRALEALSTTVEEEHVPEMLEEIMLDGIIELIAEASEDFCKKHDINVQVAVDKVATEVLDSIEDEDIDEALDCVEDEDEVDLKDIRAKMIFDLINGKDVRQVAIKCLVDTDAIAL